MEGSRPAIIDCHVHLNNYHESEAVSLSESLDRLQRDMQDAGVGYSLVLTSYLVSPHRPSTAATVNTFPGLGHTARHAMEAVSARSPCRNPQGTKRPKASEVTGAKS